MDHIKLIRSKQQHQQASTRLMALMDPDVELDGPEADERDVLELLIAKYEQERLPIEPIAAIKFRMQEWGLSRKDLIPYIGSAPKVSEVLNGVHRLSLKMIRNLHEGLGISLEVLIKEPLQYKALSKNINWNGFPLSEMYSRGYFAGTDASLKELKAHAGEYLDTFISSVPQGFELQPASLRTVEHKQDNDKEREAYALWAWQISVLQVAQKEPLANQYLQHSVNLSWMSKLAKLSWYKQGPLLAKEYLNHHGIRLIIQPHLTSSRVEAALCLTTKGNPLIALTLRNDTLDSFWFSLMRQLAHLALHLDGTAQWFVDELDPQARHLVEQESEALAQEAFIPKEQWQKGSIKDMPNLRLSSTKLEISPCIVAARIRQDSGDNRMFGMRFREKVKHFFIT